MGSEEPADKTRYLSNGDKNTLPAAKHEYSLQDLRNLLALFRSRLRQEIRFPNTNEHMKDDLCRLLQIQKLKARCVEQDCAGERESLFPIQKASNAPSL